jgi:type I restriction enzyme, S subunit
MSEQWPVKSLGELCTVVNGGTPKSKVSEYWGGEVNWITPAEMGKMTTPYIGTTNRKITELGLQKSSAKLFPPHSVILSTRAPIGHLAINTSSMSTNQGCKTLIPNDELNHKYLYYFLYFNKELLDSLGSGTTFKELSGKNLKSVKIPVPPLKEQQRIVSILDEAFQNIENRSSQVEHKLHNGKNMFQSVMANIFSQKGEGWDEKTLSEVCEDFKKDIVDGPFGSNLKREHYTEEGVPVLKIQNIKAFEIKLHKMDYVSEEKAEELKRHSFQKGDIIMTKLGNPLGVSAIVEELDKGIIVADLVRIRAQKINTKFLCYQLNSPKIKAHINSLQKGTTRPRVRITIVRDIPIVIPPLAEQQRIVNKLDSLSDSIALLEDNHRSEIESLVELKQSILQEAFSGKLTGGITA